MCVNQMNEYLRACKPIAIGSLRPGTDWDNADRKEASVFGRVLL